MATHPSVLAWGIPWTEEPGGLQSIRLRRARHDWSCTERDLELHMWLELFLLGMALVDLSVRACVWLAWFAGRVVKIGVRTLTSPTPAPVLPSLSPLCSHMCCAVDVYSFLCPGHQGSWTSVPPEAIKSFLLYCYCCSVAQSRPALCDPMDWSMPGLPVSRHLLKSAQVHVHCIGDAFQPSHPLTHSSALSLSQHQGLFQSAGSSDDQNTGASASASVLPMNIQGWFPFRLTGLISLLSRRLSGVLSSTIVWRHQFCMVSVYFTETRRLVSIIPTPPLAWDLRKNTSSSLGADTHCSMR